MDDMSPTDALKLRMELANKPVAPEQAAANRRSNIYEALSMTPGPGNVIAAQDAYTGAGDAYKAFQGGDYKQSALAAALAGLSGFGAVTGLPFGKMASQVAKDAPRTLNIFAGPTAKTADHAALAKARELKANGASRGQIWDETGWDLDKADGVPRFEIDDSGSADISPMGIGLKEFNGKARSTFYHPEYYKSYPEAADMNVRYTTEFSGGQGYGTKGFLVGAKDKEARRSTSLHELQHDAQHREGFPTGENPGRYPDLSKEEALDIYRRAAGEVEARNVQARMNMSAAERRAKAPWLTQDIPDEQQIVRGR